MTGWRKRQVIEMAREAGFEQVGHDSFQELTARMEAFAKLVREDALAQPAPYMAVLNDRITIDPHTGNVSIGTVAQPEERNFCPRCGKRTRDLTTIHTCTPPQEKTHDD